METSENQRAQVLTLLGEGYSFGKIAERTGIPKFTCTDIVKRDKERREHDNPTPYLASAPRSGGPEKMSCWERWHLISLAKQKSSCSIGHPYS